MCVWACVHAWHVDVCLFVCLSFLFVFCLPSSVGALCACWSCMIFEGLFWWSSSSWRLCWLLASLLCFLATGRRRWALSRLPTVSSDSRALRPSQPILTLLHPYLLPGCMDQVCSRDLRSYPVIPESGTTFSRSCQGHQRLSASKGWIHQACACQSLLACAMV